MNCSYCNQELISDKENYGDVLICYDGKLISHHYEKVDDGELIKFFIADNTGKYKFIQKYSFYNGRKPNFTSNFAILNDFSQFKNKTIEEIAILYNKFKIFE